MKPFVSKFSLSSLDYNAQETDTSYATCTVEFAFTWFDVKSIGDTVDQNPNI